MMHFVFFYLSKSMAVGGRFGGEMEGWDLRRKLLFYVWRGGHGRVHILDWGTRKGLN